jgi:hypothetical protein
MYIAKNVDMLKKLRTIQQRIFTNLRRSTFLRALIYPVMAYSRRKILEEYQHTEDCNYIKGLKDKHCNKRCFIIGNGPSLSPKDLDLIKDEYCFGTNRIYYIFDKTEWRPTYYVVVDREVLRTETDFVQNADVNEKFINYDQRSLFKRDHALKNNIHFVVLQEGFPIKMSAYTAKVISEDVSKYFTRLSTVTATCIEFAIYMGFKEIYLLGVDHSYPVQMHKDGKIVRDTTKKDAYFAGVQSGKHLAIQYIDQTNANYEICKKYADVHGIKIYNATRGGNLEIFERVRLEEILSVSIQAPVLVKMGKSDKVVL